uniref:BHLH domain-containing protein n=1 Tax=Nothobranchius furzeri TaxID=105023 RepID=A0A8C6LEW5_NOTFU
MHQVQASGSTRSQDHAELTDWKPLVEKLRRERINSSIEQLKSLLGAEFLKQQPDSKLEKADILEMTACVLMQQKQLQAAADQGYSRCVQEVSQRRLLNHFNKLQDLREADLCPLSSTVQTSTSKDKSPASSAPWRPW